MTVFSNILTFSDPLIEYWIWPLPGIKLFPTAALSINRDTGLRVNVVCVVVFGNIDPLVAVSS